VSQNTLRSIAKPLLIVAIVLGGLYGSYLIIQAALGTNTPIVVVTSESMHPVYYEGDILFIKHVSADDINIGDDIVFYANWSTEPDVPIVHRVIDKYLQNGVWYFVTQGTNELTNPVPDPYPTPYNQVIGVVVFTIPRIGLPIVWLRTTVGVFGAQLMLIIIAGIIIIYVALDYLTEKKEEHEEKVKGEGLWSDEEIAETEKLYRERKKDDQNEADKESEEGNG